jgi:uncharacterized protein YggE
LYGVTLFYMDSEIQRSPVKNSLVSAAAVLGIVLLLGAFIIPWSRVNWGKLELSPASTITVTGEAHAQEKSQIATFTAGASALNDDKQTAVNEVNQKIETLINSVKDFGIPGEDIQTQRLSVRQKEESYLEEGVRKVRKGQWKASNTIEITLRDVDKASELADLLTESGATDVYGPRFSLEDTQEAEVELLEEAINNAREKADKIAKSSDRKLGKIVTVNEDGRQTFGAIRLPESVGGGVPIEPGTETVYKTVTVTFELK